jgi:hypothetical protein
MPYYQVRVYRTTTQTQTYLVNVDTTCPEHAKDIATEVLEAHFDGEDHEYGGFEPVAVDEPTVAFEETVLAGCEPDRCEYTEDLFVK